jgi:carbamoyl-phosphate synthase large subunit
MNNEKILVLGSGPLKIGQAGEFDFSGSQCLKVLRNRGIETVLINPNIATVQTNKLATRTYLYPLTERWVKEILAKERPTGIMLQFGGQTALNLGLKLRDFLELGSVRVLGTSLNSIEIAENRERFNNFCKVVDVCTSFGMSFTDIDEAMDRIPDNFEFPIMLRVGYALGGAGSGMVRSENELRKKLELAFAASPEVLVEEWLGGWKEIEYEVCCDKDGRAITICNMENFDPIGVHTGESIVVAPSQTLSDEEYQELRSISLRIVKNLGVVGECNVQFAVRPGVKRGIDYRVIEVNPRLSRSSALASKATGYPIASIATKLALGDSLLEIENDVTGGRTFACTEPALDYCVVKLPVWEFAKFDGADRTIGTEMRSVGEVMAIDRNFECALQKAVRSKGEKLDPFLHPGGSPFSPTDRRLHSLFYLLYHGEKVEEICEKTGIDRWFIEKIRNIAEYAKSTRGTWREGKLLGFGDDWLERNGMYARDRDASCGFAIKRIDTLAGEYDADTNYLYTTYLGSSDDV